MKFIKHKQKLKGVYLIEQFPHSDKRGTFRRHFCSSQFKKIGLMDAIKQTNIAQNKKKHTLRGFHYYPPPNEENKIISCIKGSFYNIVLDLRKKSSTCYMWQSFKINENDYRSIFIPKGCANAYLTLEDNTWILYYHSDIYNTKKDSAINYRDPYFKFQWPFKPKVISEKDLNSSFLNLNKK